MAPFRSSSVPRSPRWRFVGGLLVLTLLAAGVLGWEAWRAARSHHEVARAALEDHARFVAWQFADRAQSKADHLVASRALWYVVARYGGEAFRSRVESETSPPAAWKQRPSFLRYAFELELPAGEARILEGEAPPPRVRSWMTGTVARHAVSICEPGWSYAVVAGAPDDRTRVIVYTLEMAADSTPTRALGFETDPAELVRAFDMAFDYPLLPPSLTGGRPNRDVLSVRVLGPDGRALYATAPAYDSTFVAREGMSARWAGLPVEVALRPEIAGELLIGGLPRSRMPWLLGVLALTVLLVAAAIVLLRRESEVARLRSEFVSNVSHELRTPLAQIRMFAETLLLGRVRSEEEEGRALEIVDQEARRLSTLVENILLFSRTERGAMRLSPRSVRVAELLEEVVDGFRPLARSRGVELRSELRDRVTAVVDPDALRQIALNFLDNAVKYGPEGGTVTLGLERYDGTYRLWVDDEGPGVPPSDRASVWQAYRRLEQTDEATAGTGIGLSVVRDLALRHGGRTGVEESPAGGARFVAELPLEPERVVGAVDGDGPAADRARRSGPAAGNGGADEPAVRPGERGRTVEASP